MWLIIPRNYFPDAQQFSSRLPSCLDSLERRTALNLNYNEIGGSTPDSVCAMQERISRGSQLRGSISAFERQRLGRPSTTRASLPREAFQGPRAPVADWNIASSLKKKNISSSVLGWAAWAQINRFFQTASLDCNQFSSSIHPSLCTESILTYLYFFDNDFTGKTLSSA